MCVFRGVKQDALLSSLSLSLSLPLSLLPSPSFSLSHCIQHVPGMSVLLCVRHSFHGSLVPRRAALINTLPWRLPAPERSPPASPATLRAAYQFVCLSVWLSISDCLSLCMSVSLCLSVCLSLYIFHIVVSYVYLFVQRNIYLSVRLSIFLSGYLSLSLSVYLSAYPPMSFPLSKYISLYVYIYIYIFIYMSDVCLSLSFFLLSVFLSFCEERFCRAGFTSCCPRVCVWWESAMRRDALEGLCFHSTFLLQLFYFLEGPWSDNFIFLCFFSK